MIEFPELNADQQQAVLHALAFGSPVDPGDDVYVILSLVRDYLVQGTFDSEGMADRIMRSAPNTQDRRNGWNDNAIAQSLDGWSAEQRRNREIVHTVVEESTLGASLITLGEVIPSAHPDWTNCASAKMAKKTRGGRQKISIRNVTNVRVTITLKKGKGEKRARTLSTTLGPRVDAIFLTRGAHELFVFPAYEEAFGKAYVEKLRDRLGLPKPSLSSDEAGKARVGSKRIEPG